MRFAPLFFAAALAAASAAQAQEPPARVGRVAHIEGQASLYQDPEAGWEKAYVNSPLTSENSVWTDRGSRAEVRISGMALRLDELTQLDIPKLDDDELDAFIPRGSVAVRVRHYENNERLVFNTPNARVRLRANGRYRVDVDHERQETRVTVFEGEARIGTDDGRIRLGAGRSALVFGFERPEFVEERAVTDAFDRWTLARDDRWREGRAPTYVSTYMTGYEDLDAHGEWSNEPDYGVLWYPSRVASTWAPYRHGHWSYVRPWGWTWIDEAPWGYAPFHYGRWVYVRNRWAWHPGERVARPVWAPALVAWVGGANFNVRVSSGPSVGWYPLSPWDRYDPWFNASPAYVNRVNVVVRNDRPTREDRRHWHEWTRERGTTVVERSALLERRQIAQAAIPVTVEAIRQAPVSRQPEAILPSRNDLIQRRRQQPQPAVPAPTVGELLMQPGGPAAQRPAGPAAQQPAGRSAVVRPEFGRRAVAATPLAASAPPSRRQETAQQPVTREERERAVRQQTDQAIRDVQQPGQAQERAQREAAQQQQQQRQQQQAQERAQREAQQAQERAQRDAQQAQERGQREAAQQQQQQRQQQQAQERAQREAQQAQERAQREAQQAQERAQREAAQRQQQQQPPQRPQPPSREERERAVRQQTDQAVRDAQQQQQQAQERAAREAQRQKDKEKEKDKDKDKEDGKGKGNKP